MSAKNIRPIALLSLVLLWSCDKTAPSDPRSELLGSLEGANVEGYLFAFEEDKAGTRSSLTNPAVRELVQLGQGDSETVLGYARIQRSEEHTSELQSQS